MKTYFVNEALDFAISNYLNSLDKKEGVLYNSFLVVIVRMLINIYGELDIINPYKMGQEGIFDINLMKYGMNKENIQEFKRLLDGFYRIEKKNLSSIKKETNVYFIEVQKKVIDMFNLKRINYGVTESSRLEFFDLLYTPGTSNALRLSYNYLNADDIYEVCEYFKVAMEKQVKVKEAEEKDLLPMEAYKAFGINIADLSKMNNEEVENLNSEIYKSFDIKENAINKDYLLDKSLENLMLERKLVTTGNGYVDILLIMSIIVTTVMVVLIFSTFVF